MPTKLKDTAGRPRTPLNRRGLFALALVGTLGCTKKASKSSASKTIKIAVIPKGTTHEFWKSVQAGAIKAAREAKVEIVWKGPLKEDDLKSQIDLVQSFTAQNVSGIVLAPLNDKALGSAVKGATRRKIPVLIFDSALSGGTTLSFVATDNRAAGRLAAVRMVKLLRGEGKVIILRYQEGSASTHAREEGFVTEIRKHKGISIVSDNQFGGATTESAHKASERLLLAKDAANDGVQGVFCPNESTTFGMLLALRKTKLAGKIRFIGFDSSDKLVAALGKKHLDGLVLQDPFNMGYLAVKTMADHLRGKPIKKRIDTGSRLADATNMNQPEIKNLLKPNLKRWLEP